MSQYDYVPLSWNGATIVAGSVRAAYWDGTDPSPLTAAQPVDAVEATVVTWGDRDVRGQPKGVTWLLTVELSSFGQADLDALNALFDESAGQVYFRVTDGGAKVWRVQARLLGPPKRADVAIFQVPIRVADPHWEEDTQATITQSNMSGSGPTFNVTNAGTRRASPQATITPTSVKTDCIDDWKYALRGQIVNSSSRAFVDRPVYLFDQLGAQARIDTRTLIQDTTVSNLLNNTSGISAFATTIPIDTPVGGGLPARGGAWIGSEQIYYTGNTGTQLTGVVRGVGGSTQAAHPDNSVISKSEALFNGDDVAVWLNGQQVDRYLVNWNTASSDVVVNATLPPSRIAMSVTNQVFSAGMTTLLVTSGIDLLDGSGFLLLSSAGGMEVVYYSAKAGRSLTGMARGLWGTSAVNHGPPITVYADPLQFVVGVGKLSATNPSPDATRRPCIQLPGSSNQAWKWGDEADDANTCFFDLLNPDRTAGWTPGYDTDGNDKITPLVALTNSTTKLEFTDQDIGAGALPYNQAQISLPQGTAAAGNIVADWNPVAEILNLELWGTDTTGTAKLLDQLQQAAAAAGRTFALTKSLGVLKLKARNNVIIGFRADQLTAVIGLSATRVALAVRFTYTTEHATTAFWAKLASNNAVGQTIEMQVFTDNGGVPGTFVRSLRTEVLAPGGDFAWYRWRLGPATLRKAGTYWIVMTGSTTALWATDQSAGGPDSSNIVDDAILAAVKDSSWISIPQESPGIYLTSGYDRSGNALIEPDTNVVNTLTGARTGLAANFDKVIVPLGAFPIVHRVSGFLNSLYHCAGVLIDNTTGDQIAADRWMKLGTALLIDADARTVTHLEDGVTYRVPGACAPSNLADWMAWLAGVNSITYSELNMVSTTLALAWRGKKV